MEQGTGSVQNLSKLTGLQEGGAYIPLTVHSHPIYVSVVDVINGEGEGLGLPSLLCVRQTALLLYPQKLFLCTMHISVIDYWQ